MATHKAYVQSAIKAPLTIELVQTSSPSSGQVLVTVLASPVLSYAADVLSGSFPLVHPLTPGASAIGRIAATGEDTTALQVGQLVFCDATVRARDDHSGGTSILQGWFGGISPGARRLMEGTWRNGSWAQKMLVPLENVTVLDEQVLVHKFGYHAPQLCWINTLLVPYGGWRAAGLGVGDVVIVAPATGHFGGAAVRVALALGARLVVVAGRNEKTLEALEVGHTVGKVKKVVLTGDVDVDANALKMASGGKGADIYIDFSPAQAADATHPQACLSALKPGGQAILMGGISKNISFNYAHLMLNSITIRGQFMYDADAPMKVVGLLESGALTLEGLESTAFDFEQLDVAIHHAQTHAGLSKSTVLQVST